jgi:Ni2+-binding GTPase involved in maturation of urease and hydrogenase
MLQYVLDAVEMLREIETGKWELVENQLILYKSDNTTEIVRFDLFDQNNDPSMANVFKRVRKITTGGTHINGQAVVTG